MYVNRNVIYILRMRWRWGGSVQIVGHRLRWSRVEGSAYDLVLFVSTYLPTCNTSVLCCLAAEHWNSLNARSRRKHRLPQKKLEEEQQSQQKHSFVKLHILQALIRGGSISGVIIGFNFKDWLLGKPDHKLIFKTNFLHWAQITAIGSAYYRDLEMFSCQQLIAEVNCYTFYLSTLWLYLHTNFILITHFLF